MEITLDLENSEFLEMVFAIHHYIRYHEREIRDFKEELENSIGKEEILKDLIAYTEDKVRDLRSLSSKITDEEIRYKDSITKYR